MTIDKTIRVFLEGKGTFCEWRFDTGVSLGRILNQGEGMFLPDKFSSVTDAREYCEMKLKEDPSLIYYIFTGEDITDTVMNLDYQQAQERRERQVYGFISSVAIFILSLIVSIAVIQFETIMGHSLYIAGIMLLYFMFLYITGAGNIEGAIMMVIVLLISGLLGTRIIEYLDESHEAERTGIELGD